MAETKKRFRPSLTAYRALENEVSELKEELAKYITMKNTLEKSNELMEQELDRVRKSNIELGKLNGQLCNELQAIKSRGFWKRLFNRE